MADFISDIKDAMKKKRLVLGTESTVKNLKLGKLAKVFATNNCPEDVKGDLEYYGELANVPVVYLSIPNDELGTICKKQFAISVLGQKK
jgi:ribosomal protein L30E